uniref:Nucleic acid-binding protein n=1 Tax=Tetraselmis sp. GSL018 TaxID=582737 RepID=A0A061S449_9CHLO
MQVFARNISCLVAERWPSVNTSVKAKCSLRVASSQMRAQTGLVQLRQVKLRANSLTGPTRPANVPDESDTEEAKQDLQKNEMDVFRMESWAKILDAKKTGNSETILLVRYNNSGFVAKCHGVTGFIPYSHVDPAKLPPKGEEGAVDQFKAMLGTHLTVKVIEADVKADRIIFSETECLKEQCMRGINVGDIRDGVVRNVTDYGAFVVLKGPDGKTSSALGLLHKSEMTWDSNTVVTDLLQPGQDVTVKIIGVDPQKGRISLSSKQCQDDPVLASLDTVFAVEDDPSVVWEESGSLLEGLDELCRELRSEDGVLLVTPGRQAEVPRVSAPDLQIFMTKQQVTDGFNLVARLGTRVQEVHVATDLRREQMKVVLRNALNRLGAK